MHLSAEQSKYVCNTYTRNAYVYTNTGEHERVP